ncbi:MAG: hypothetical protein SFH39_15435 [Candidatus Magnetobacterium sp. LHC-1]|nr:hypothetical protein [Nitrospirota bacterium]
MDERIRELENKFIKLEEGQRRLEDKIDNHFALFCQKIDGLTTLVANNERALNVRIDGIEKALNARIDSTEKNLGQRMDFFEKSVDEKISNKFNEAKLQLIMWIVGVGMTTASLAVAVLKLWK